MVGKRENFLKEIGRESADIARDSLRSFFFGKGLVRKAGKKGTQGDTGRGDGRGSHERPLMQILRFEKEAEENSLPALW